MSRSRRRHDRGFTMIELTVVMSLFGIVVALAYPAWRSHQRSQEEVGTVRTAVSFLRDAQVRAVSEEVTYCVAVSASALTMQQMQVDKTYRSVAVMNAQGASFFSGAAFNQSGGGTSSTACFYPRGAASQGTVLVKRSNTAKTYTITVEGLTGRVSYS